MSVIRVEPLMTVGTWEAQRRTGVSVVDPCRSTALGDVGTPRWCVGFRGLPQRLCDANLGEGQDVVAGPVTIDARDRSVPTKACSLMMPQQVGRGACGDCTRVLACIWSH